MEQIIEEIPTAVDNTVDVSSSIPCNLCKKTFARNSGLFKHQRNVHKILPTCISRLRCPQQDCEYTCSWMDPLRRHLRNSHSIHIEEIKLTFPSMSGKQVTRTSTHHRLQSLLVEMDMEKFHQELSAFLEEVQEHKESCNFASRFQDQFAHRPEMWARSFMGPDLAKIMSSLETVHRALKCAFLKGKDFRHLVRCLSALEKLVQDRNNCRLAKTDSFGADGQNASGSDADVLVEVVEEDRLWIVKIGLQESHSVHRTSDTCLVANCTGAPCNHCYACSCTDNLGHEKSCGHIQAVAQLQLTPNGTQSSEAENTDTTLDRSVEEKTLTILGFLKKRKIDQDLLRQMEQQMDVWITKVKNGSRTHAQNNSQPPIQPESSCKDVFLVIYPQQVSSTVNLKVPISRYKSPASVLKKAFVNGPSGFDHTY